MALTKKDTSYIWEPQHHTTFTKLIHAFTTAPVLLLPDRSCPFRLITDASDYTLGAILEQPDALHKWHPIAYHSKSLQPTELNYDIHDKELLAIVHSLETFRHYLEGHPLPFEIWTDHNNLTYFRTKHHLTRRQAHWSLFLSKYNFTLVHKPSVYNKADPLSRRPNLKEGMVSDESEDQILLNQKFFTIRATRPITVDTGKNHLRQRIKEAQTYDTEVS
jgi:hypothetical protein